MMLSPAMNTAATVGRRTDMEGDDAGRRGPGGRPRRSRTVEMEGDDAGRRGPRWGHLPLAGESPTVEVEGDDAGRRGPRWGPLPLAGESPTIEMSWAVWLAYAVGDQLHPVAIPAELHHAGQADTAGVHQRHWVAGAFRGVDPVESVGVGHSLRRYQLAEVKHHRPGVGALGVGVGLDDHR